MPACRAGTEALSGAPREALVLDEAYGADIATTADALDRGRQLFGRRAWADALADDLRRRAQVMVGAARAR